MTPLPRDVTDRNRTSPFAFTGNKFEFRAVGSNQSCAWANVVLNTIVADAIDDICTQLESDLKEGKDFNAALQTILQDIVKKHKRVLFNGDNYTEEWHKEAEKRGLPNLKTTPEALKEMKKKETVDLFKRRGVLSKTELESRYEIYTEQYEKTIEIEAECALTIANTMIIPAVLEYQDDLASAINGVKDCGCKLKETEQLLKKICSLSEKALAGAGELESSIGEGKPAKKKIEALNELRKAADELEGLVPEDKWPLPSYAEMMFRF